MELDVGVVKKKKNKRRSKAKRGMVRLINYLLLDYVANKSIGRAHGLRTLLR